METLGPLLREFRLAAGLSQDALADRARMSSAAVSTLERGARKAAQRQTVALLAEALRLSPPDRERLENAALSNRRRKARSDPEQAPVQHNLPHLISSFEGRENDLRTLAGFRDRRLVTLIGPGGVGKTRLSLEAARAQMAAHDLDGVWFVDLSAFTDPELVTATIAGTLNVRERAAEPLIATLIDWLSPKNVLLILDNCEHVIGEAARTAELLLRGCERLHILATSREALDIDGEVRVTVGPLPVGEARVDGPAVRLFLERVAQAQPFGARVPTEGEVAAARTICRRLDGLPLALELAAGRARDFSLQEIALRLDERFELLNKGRRTASVRQQSLSGAIDWSYITLAACEQKLFCRLGVFAGSFTSEAAIAVCDDGDGSARDGIVSLIAKSLLGVVEDPSGRLRYRYLETIRAYALDRLDERVERVAATAKFSQYFSDFASQAGDRYPGEFPRAVVTALESDLENFREALYATLIAKHDLPTGARLAAACGRIFWQLAMFAESIRWCERALSNVEMLPDEVAASLWHTLSTAVFNLGNMQRALATSKRAVALYESAGAVGPLSSALHHGAHALYQMGRAAEAKAMVDKALHAARESGEDWRIGLALRMNALITKGPDALAMMEEALRRLRASEQPSSMSTILMGIAESSFADADYEKALRYGIEAVEIARVHSHRARFAGALTNVAAYSLAAGDFERARAATREALLAVRDMGATMNAMYALQHAGSCAAYHRNACGAARLLGASDRLYEEFSIVREHTERTLYDQACGRVREILTDADFEKHREAGKALPLIRAIDEALTV